MDPIIIKDCQPCYLSQIVRNMMNEKSKHINNIIVNEKTGFIKFKAYDLLELFRN